MNNKAQLGGLVAFIGVVIVLVLLAPIMLKLGTTMLTKTGQQLEIVDTTNRSAVQVEFVKTKFTGTMDWIVMLLVIINILVLFVSSFLVDINPAFVVIYIIGAFCLVISAPYAMASAEQLYQMDTFASGSDNVIQHIPMTNFLMNNFGVVIVGVIVLTGIVLFAKTKFGFGGQGGTY